MQHLDLRDTYFHTSYNSNKSKSLFRIQEYNIQKNSNIPVKAIYMNLVIYSVQDSQYRIKSESGVFVLSQEL